VIFEEMGLEAASTNIIAERAGLPIGTLYQFFPNKEALMQGLIERYLERLRAVLTLDASLPITALIEELIVRLDVFEENHAAFTMIFLENRTISQIHREIVVRIDDLLERYFPALDAGVRTRTAETSVAMVKGMMSLYSPAGSSSHPINLSEIQLGVVAYLRAVLVREGHPLPSDLAAL
jgi:AcrR family transcriptional regulator